MAARSNFVSQTHQSVAKIKIREQVKRRNTFEARKAEIIEATEAETDESARVEVLLSGFKDVSLNNDDNDYVKGERKDSRRNMSLYLDQAKYDASMHSGIIRQFEGKLRQKLDQESERLRFTDLYCRLLLEWADPKSKPIEESGTEEHPDDPSAQAHRYNLQQLRDKFSNMVFTPLETDEVEIDTYLSSLFDDYHGRELLNDTRSRVAHVAAKLTSPSAPFTEDILKDCIEGLLTNDLLDEDSKTNLSEISESERVLEEVVEMLNARFADFENWSWDADEGLYYEPRKQINGKYRIMVDQDVMQALFLHYIAVSWSGKLKEIFCLLPNDSAFWKTPEGLSQDDCMRHSYFTEEKRTHNDGFLGWETGNSHRQFFLCSLPDGFDAHADPYKGNKTVLETRQSLLRQIATNLIIRRELHGEAAIVQSDLRWYASSLPHSTLFAVLRFWGVPANWLEFFKKVVEAPLRMGSAAGEDVRTRKRGIFITDAFEKLFGECVLFCMDLAVNRLSGMIMLRLHDDLWLHGKPSDCAHAWKTIEGFVSVFGLGINTSKTGSLYISNTEKDTGVAAALPKGTISVGLLQLTEAGEWVINQDGVSEHVQELRKQLGRTKDILSWVKTYNEFMTTFCQKVFNHPANCFGQDHVIDILETFSNMHRELFSSYNGSPTNYLKEKIQTRFGVEDVPDPFFYLYELFGGLGLYNPYIPFLRIKDRIKQNPIDAVKKSLDKERKAYDKAKQKFEALGSSEKQARFNKAFDNNSIYYDILDESFYSFEEYTAYPEIYSRSLREAYDDLMYRHNGQDVRLTRDVEQWFEELRETHGRSYYSLSSETRWIMYLYAEEIRERFGGLSIVDIDDLPNGLWGDVWRMEVQWPSVLGDKCLGI